MKKLVMLLLLMTLAVGCRHLIHDGVAGSGKRLIEKRTIGSFTSISTEGAYDIEVLSGQPGGSLELEGDDNILPMITTEISNNVLHIRSLRSFSVHRSITLRISVPNLEGVSASGAGRIEISGLKNEKFVLDVNGAPTIRVSGETKNLEIGADGAANIDTHKLRADRVVVGSEGVSKVEVYATSELEVTVSGPSHVVYHGDPHVKQTINGPGSVTKKEPSGS